MRTVSGLRAFAARAKLTDIDHESVIFVNVLTPFSELELQMGSHEIAMGRSRRRPATLGKEKDGQFQEGSFRCVSSR
jgi:hypothetical protein